MLRRLAEMRDSKMYPQVIDQARNKLRINCAPVQIPIGLEHEHEGLVDLLGMKAYHFDGVYGETIKDACLLTIWMLPVFET